jgi:S-DNA-T family DNA segregation ATPase FtsK/SpoIIIE
MNAQQRAVVAAAKKDGLSPMEIAAELMNHDITEVVLGLMRKREVAFNKLSEKDQDAVIAEVGSELKKITATAARVINSQGIEAVRATMKSLKIDGKLTATMVIDGDEPNRHVLTDKTHDRSDILIVLYPNNYSEGMGAHQGDKDQKELSLEDEKPAKKPRAKKQPDEPKPVEVPKKFLDDARDFVTIQQNCTIAGLQNQMRCGYEKAVATLDLLRAEGVVTRTGEAPNDQFELVRAMVAAAAPKDAEGLPETYGDLTYSEVQQTVVMRAKSFYLPWLSDRFKIEGEQAEHLALRLLDDGVIEAELPQDSEGQVTYKVIATLADLEIAF